MKKAYVVRRGDAFEVLKVLRDESVDCVITDPPYESLEKHRAHGTTTRLKVSKMSSNEWFEVVKNERLPELLAELYRVMKRNTHCYMFCDGETSDVLRDVVRAMPKRQNFKWWKRLVWDKQCIGMGYHWRARHEFIVFLEKGKRRLNNLGLPDVLNAKRIANGYPTEKPVELAHMLIGNSTQVGDIVLDPFCGSGSTGVAAVALARRFIGFDISEKAIIHTAARLRNIGFDITLPEVANAV